MIVWSVIAPLTVMTALGTGLQAGAPDSGPPTALEQALIEYVCSASRAATPGTDAHQACLGARLESLRADFGPDLKRLTPAERKTIDAVCSKVTATRGREGYVACLSDQLVALSNRRIRAHPVGSATPTPTPPVSEAVLPVPPTPQPVSRFPTLWVAGGLSILLVVAAGAFVAAKLKQAPTKCRVCGAKVPDRGDLCQKCRHEAADVLRRAATERADELRAKEESQRRQHELVERQMEENARHEEEARVRREEDARQREALVAQRLAEEAAMRADSVASDSEVSGNHFDPYSVLGVPQDASEDDIRVAYERARKKYAPDQVAHLSNELQDHYKEKADEVEQAYQTLTEGRPSEA